MCCTLVYFTSNLRLRPLSSFMKWTALLLCLFLPLTSYSQNIYRALRESGKKIKVERTIVVPPSYANLARKVATKRVGASVSVSVNRQLAVVTSRFQQRIQSPDQIVGGYNYLRMAGRAFQKNPLWRGRLENGGYNGAHHIVTKTVIKEIAQEVGIEDPREMMANAPAVYSLLHNRANYSHLFHDHPRLLELYHQQGVKGMVLTFFERLNAAHQKMGLAQYDQAFIETELLEAELWAKSWGLKWE